MNTTKKRISAVLLAGVLSLSLLASCGSGPETGGSAAPAPQTETTQSLGDFTTTDLEGNPITQEIFADYDLTMINIFATWCGPCVSEIPELEQLSQAMEPQGVKVMGVVLDILNPDGTMNEQAMEQAELLAQRTGATYPFLIPDSSGFRGRLFSVTSIPETIFVDRQGNLVGESYMGARDLAAWTEIVQQKLAEAKA